LNIDEIGMLDIEDMFYLCD